MSWESTKSIGLAAVVATLWGGNVMATPTSLTGPSRPSTASAYTAVWAERGGEAHIVSTSSLPGFLALDDQREVEGFQLIDFETTVGNAGRRYAGIWHEAPASALGFAEAAHLSVDVPLVDLSDVVATEAAQDYKLADLEIYTIDSVPMFAAIFHPSTAEQAYVVGIDAALLVAFNNGFGANTDFRLVDVEMYSEAGVLQYAAIWRQQAVPPSIIVAEAAWPDLIDTDVTHHASFQLNNVEAAREAGPVAGSPWFFTGAWRAAPSIPTYVLVPATWDQLVAKHQELIAIPPTMGHPGWLPVDIEILWHVDGVVKSSLTVTHDGPMVPPPGL